MAERKPRNPFEDDPKTSLGPHKRTAIAIRYDIEKDAAPLVLASGRGRVADEIMRIAKENNIPLVENPRMADLLSKLEIDTFIPPELYVLVAEILYFVYQLDKMSEKRDKFFKAMKKNAKNK